MKQRRTHCLCTGGALVVQALAKRIGDAQCGRLRAETRDIREHLLDLIE